MSTAIWFVNDRGQVYWLRNGSAYEVDPSDGPLVDLEPGYYDVDLKAASIPAGVVAG